MTDANSSCGPGPDQVLDVIVIGAGQAGLAVAWHLAQRGLRFLVLQAADQLGSSWRGRWDSLRLFSPAQYDALPVMAFPRRPTPTRARKRWQISCVTTPPGSICRCD